MNNSVFAIIMQHTITEHYTKYYPEMLAFFSAVTYDELKENGLYPSGANYMVSNDSIHFVQGKTAEKRQSRLGGLGQRKALCV